MSEALIFASTNPQYDDRLFIVHENYKLRIPAEHGVYTNCCFCFDIQNFCTHHVLLMLRASEKDIPVIWNEQNKPLKKRNIDSTYFRTIQGNMQIVFHIFLGQWDLKTNVD